MSGTEEYDEANPNNPRLLEDFRSFVRRKKEFISSLNYPPGTRFECTQCGDCCTWNFWHFEAKQDLIDKLKELGGENPHGAWVLLEKGIRFSMPYWEEKLRQFSFSGKMPQDHFIFHQVSGRTHGYWVLNEGIIIIYSPVKCIHLADNGLCGVYEDRPQVCRAYSCRKNPIIP